MQAMALHQICQTCGKEFTGAANHCDSCTPVSMTLKHEGTVGGKVIGPLYYEMKDGTTKPFSKGSRGTDWFKEPDARKIAKENKLPFEVF